MARPLRLAFENACYHITSRGMRKENIFYGDEDKSIFLEKLNETFKKYSVVCYAYCLMDNHYHLFVKTPRANISQAMHYLNTSYTNWFKADHEIIGSVLQGRYKSILVDEDSYGIVLSAYIHLNPLRARIVEDLREYKWSSYFNYVKDNKRAVDSLDTEFILTQFSEDSKEARRLYRRYVRGNKNIKDPLKDSFKGMVLGSREYVSDILKKIIKLGKRREIPETRRINRKTSDEIIKAMEKKYNISKEDITEKKKGNIFRKLSMYLIKKYTDLRLEQIGKIYNMDYTAVSQSCSRFHREISGNKRLNKMIKEIEDVL
jgi:REP element-mobilizing transposase RayT